MRGVADVVDLEVLLARDEEQAARDGPEALFVRDQALGRSLPDGPGQLSAWVDARRERTPDLPGERARGVLLLVGAGVCGLGALLGAGAGAALLAYDGQVPVNVLAWALYTAAVPLALFALLGVGLLLPRRIRPRGPAQSLLAAVIEPLLRRLPGGARWTATLFGRAREGKAASRWLLVGLTQGFTAAYVGAALATLLVSVAVTDLTFGWSTTLDVDEVMPQFVSVTAAPWAWIVPGAAPRPEDLSRTKYHRFTGRFEGTDVRTPVPPELSARWWRWAALVTLVYGLLPRLAVLALSLWGWRRAMRRWPSPDRSDVAALLRRLGPADGVFAARGPVAPPPPETPEPVAAPGVPAGLAVTWGRAAESPSLVASALGLDPDTAVGAGLDFDLSAERAALAAAAAHEGPVTVLVPADEPPVEDVLAFLRELGLVARDLTVVGLEPGPEGWRARPLDPGWARAVARLDGVKAA